MIKIVTMSALLFTGMVTTAAASDNCCMLGVQGRAHDHGDVVRAFNYRHGFGFHRHAHMRHHMVRKLAY